MNRTLSLSIVVIVVLVIAGFVYMGSSRRAEAPETREGDIPVNIMPISHATAVLDWEGTVIYIDPIGGAEAFEGQPVADLVLVTDIHGDHLDIDTLSTVAGEASIIAPVAVVDELPQELSAQSQVLANDESLTEQELLITAIPMYNIPESEDTFHVKGRGNGYVLERDGFRVYIAGDTSGTPEMRALLDIDIAFVPMNLPFTMDVDEAAEAVLDFAPRQVYPYHYRGRNGLSDVGRFKELVEAGSNDIEIVLLDWYPSE